MFVTEKDKLLAVPVAFALISKVVLFVIEIILASVGIFVPVINIPTSKLPVVETVIVASPFVVLPPVIVATVVSNSILALNPINAPSPSEVVADLAPPFGPVCAINCLDSPILMVVMLFVYFLKWVLSFSGKAVPFDNWVSPLLPDSTLYLSKINPIKSFLKASSGTELVESVKASIFFKNLLG